MTRAFLLTALAGTLVGCATAPQGAREAPESWRQAQSLSNCGSTDGRFDEVGAPAPDNAHADIIEHTAWPVMGSLSAMARTGANGASHGGVANVSIEIVDGRPHFKAFGADGTEVPLMEREWWCDQKALVTRTVLGNAPGGEGVPALRDESVLRLWRAQDGALIAEQTLENVTPGMLGSSSNHRALNRSYFRFPPLAAPR